MFQTSDRQEVEDLKILWRLVTVQRLESSLQHDGDCDVQAASTVHRVWGDTWDASEP
jgi:hypothetical protein